MKKNTIYQENCIEGMKRISSKSVDLIIADPPYNLSKGNTINFLGNSVVKGMGGEWNKAFENWDNYSLIEYFEFTKQWLTEAKRIMKNSGSMWIFGTYHNIGIINFLCQMLDLEIINEIIWYKSNSFPNLAGRRLTASHETILWVHNNPKKRLYKFNYEYSKNGDFDYDNLKSPTKQMRTVWSIPNNKKKWELSLGKHPTQKPIRIMDRIINLTTDEEDLVLAPFSGAGTECLSAKRNNRKYIGFEIENEYYELSIKRLEMQVDTEND
ncbi:MAG: site-specific DNA-methyltransferase [Candidatus Delongbacteria bacterium]|nr:site-specific DNA-methyltransferase [Candidatus Delongbacteria bacterium]